MIRFLKSVRAYSYFQFSSKKPKEPTRLSVSKFKIDQSLDGQLIYRTDKSKSFGIVGLAICCGIIISLLVVRSRATIKNIIPLTICIGAAIVYQRRISKTMRQIIVQKSGETLKFETYGLFGSPLFMSEGIMPIHILKGVHRQKINKAILIKGGGQFGYVKFAYYFHQQGVIDKLVFDTILNGTMIKYKDKL